MGTKEKVRKTPPSTRQATSTKRRSVKREESRPVPQDVVYLPPKPLNRSRLLLRLVTVLAIVIAVVLAMSVFFKVENIEVLGVNKYSEWDISQTSGIREGDHLMSFGIAGAAAKVQSLPYVKDVRIGIRLPNTVVISVKEVEVTYAIKAQDESWWLISSAGQIVEKAEEGEQEKHTKILGVHVLNPAIGQNAVALEMQQPVVDAEGNTLPVTVTAAQHLSVALDITEYLENNGIIGKAASIDVNDLADVQLWYGTQYQVKLGDTGELSYKISCVKSAVEQLDAYQSGVLDVSFSDGQNDVKYTPFQ